MFTFTFGAITIASVGKTIGGLYLVGSIAGLLALSR